MWNTTGCPPGYAREQALWVPLYLDRGLLEPPCTVHVLATQILISLLLVATSTDTILSVYCTAHSIPAFRGFFVFVTFSGFTACIGMLMILLEAEPIRFWIAFEMNIFSFCFLDPTLERVTDHLQKTNFESLQILQQTTDRVRNRRIKFVLRSIREAMIIASVACYAQYILRTIAPGKPRNENIVYYSVGCCLLGLFFGLMFAGLVIDLLAFRKTLHSALESTKAVDLVNSRSTELALQRLIHKFSSLICAIPIGGVFACILWFMNGIIIPVYTTYVFPFHFANFPLLMTALLIAFMPAKATSRCRNLTLPKRHEQALASNRITPSQNPKN